MSADRDRGTRRQKQKRAKQQKKAAKQAFRSATSPAGGGSAQPAPSPRP